MGRHDFRGTVRIITSRRPLHNVGDDGTNHLYARRVRDRGDTNGATAALLAPYDVCMTSYVFFADGRHAANTQGQFQGNAARLREYWVRGAGAARIRWGTDGDLTRCHREVRSEVPASEMSDDDIWGLRQNYHIAALGRPNPRD